MCTRVYVCVVFISPWFIMFVVCIMLAPEHVKWNLFLSLANSSACERAPLDSSEGVQVQAPLGVSRGQAWSLGQQVCSFCSRACRVGFRA